MSNKDKRGRKEVKDKKVAVHVLPRQSEIDALGGKEEVRKICEAHISQCAFTKLMADKALNTAKGV